MTPDEAKKLREQFPSSAIGQLPKPVNKDAAKGNCPHCGGYHGLPAVHLDYVGHAATTDRLLTVDPEWTWRPFTTEEIAALPPNLRSEGLWIHLTVCGVTRPGVGDGKSAKECIGDAIRNAAMRFGVALDLWAKEDLHEISQGKAADVPDALLTAKREVKAAWEATHDGTFDAAEMSTAFEQWAARPIADAAAEDLQLFAADLSRPQTGDEAVEAADSQPDPAPSSSPTRRGHISPKQVTALSIAFADMDLDHDAALDWLERHVGRRVESRKDLTSAEAKRALDDALMVTRGKGAPDAVH